jgi:hypothetical protein
MAPAKTITLLDALTAATLVGSLVVYLFTSRSVTMFCQEVIRLAGKL